MKKVLILLRFLSCLDSPMIVCVSFHQWSAGRLGIPSSDSEELLSYAEDRSGRTIVKVFPQKRFGADFFSKMPDSFPQLKPARSLELRSYNRVVSELE